MLAVTIKPIENLQHFGACDRHEKCHAHLQQAFNSMVKRYSKLHKHVPWWFRMELSEPIGKDIHSNGPRFHWHGLIYLKDEMGVYIWLCDLMPVLLALGSLHVSHITTQSMYTDWISYCLKQQLYLPKNFICVSNGGAPPPYTIYAEGPDVNVLEVNNLH